jgi:quinoprotein glucose dehydrogenase
VPFVVGKETVVFPGFDGGAEWGGPAVDPDTGIIYINANEMAWTASLFEDTGAHGARAVYDSQCAVCHGKSMAGSPPEYPSLVAIGDRMSPADIALTIRNGKGRMPGFPNLYEDQLNGVINLLLTGENKDVGPAEPRPAGMKYRLTGYRRFLDPEGYPAIGPPWGTLNAIDLNTGEYKWKINLGEYPELTAKGMKNTGSENYGGPLVTAGGLLFIGATNFDHKFRAFDKSTGELLWETTLPFSGNASPITYVVNGRQYVAIAAGGGKDPRHGSGGGVYVAFALPEKREAPASGR